MNLFDFFRRKKAPVQETPPGVLLPNGKTVSQRLASLLPQLEPLALPCIRITAKPASDLFLFDSKFGGHPYWPKNKAYPVDSHGNYMYLLAQLNFSQIPGLEGYPEKGILQFFLAADDIYGLDVDHPTQQTGFRVVYWEDSSEPALDNFHFLDEQERDSALPLEQPMQLTFSLDKDYYSFSDCRYPEEVADDLLGADKPVKGQRSLEDELTEVFSEGGHKMGGYAFFTQDDPRREMTYRDYILLLQIDSQGDHICWGDLGVGNFFIHPDALRQKDFSQVLYNWDCT
ncbi:DUF1963 domain-containing protein [Flavisolibacter sp. BT320]|nr:DUF1963 domain-containing protein [Flavisolibacter longurius]